MTIAYMGDLPKVLLVDDDADVRYMTRVNLHFEGFEVVEASDGYEAIDLAQSERPDIVVLDVMMPGRDGLQVLRDLRADATLEDVPVVLLSARAGREAETEGWEVGATAYVTKPFTVSGLAATLRKLLEQDPGERAEARRVNKERLDLSARLQSPQR